MRAERRHRDPDPDGGLGGRHPSAGARRQAPDCPTGRGGRLTAQPDLTVEGFPQRLRDRRRAPTSPAHDGRTCRSSGPWPCRPAGGRPTTSSPTSPASPRKPFHYKDKGIMAMIGDGAAIAEVGTHHHELHGHVAFAAWLGRPRLADERRARSASTRSSPWAWDFVGSSRSSALARSGRPRRSPASTGATTDTERRATEERRDRALRRHHHRHRAGGGTLAHTLAGTGQADPAARAGQLPPPRDGQLGPRARSSSTASYISPGHLVRRRRQARSSRRCTTTSAARRSCTAPRSTACGPQDFGELRHVDGISPAWPVTYDDFEPYYTKAEWLYQVHGNHGEDPTEGPLDASSTRGPRCPTSRGSSSCPTTWPPAATTRSTRRAGSCSTRPTGRRAPASVAPGATATRAWCTPRPTPRPSPCARSSTSRT